MNAALIPDGFRLERLSREHPRKQFTCGEARVDEWLWTKAFQNQEKHLATTRVLLDGASAIAGFYTIAISEVECVDLPDEIRKRMPQRRLPIAVLAWMGVSVSHQGNKLGSRILSLALRECHEASKTFAFVALVVDCINDSSLAFFRKWDFTTLPSNPYRLFLGARRLDAMMGE